MTEYLKAVLSAKQLEEDITLVAKMYGEDQINPLNHTPDEKVTIKKQFRKRRSMASIYQYDALANIDKATAARDGSTFESPDKELYEAGVRPGQVWSLEYGGTQYYVAVAGYHNKGFLIFNLSAHDKVPIKNVSLFRYPRKMKDDLLRRINQGDIYMISCPSPRILDKHGNALPGMELSVLLSSLMVYPGYWHDPTNSMNYFVSTCKEGHYRVTGWFLPSGGECNEDCKETATSDNLYYFLDQLLCKVYYSAGASRSIRFIGSEKDRLAKAVVPFSFVESGYLSRRILKSNCQGVLPYQIEMEEEPNSNDWREQTRVWTEQSGIHSGQLYIIDNSEAAGQREEYYARIHRRGCGNLHVELNKDGIFTGKTDPRLLRDMLDAKLPPTVRFKGKNRDGIQLENRFAMVPCTCCGSEDPVICIPSSVLRKPLEKKHLATVSTQFDKKEEHTRKRPVISNIVFYKNGPALFYKVVKTKSGQDRAMLVLPNGRVTTADPNHIYNTRVTPEIHRRFFDNDLLLKRRFAPNRWHEIVTVGSQLRVHPLVEREELRSLAGQTVTVTDPPVRTGDSYGVKVLESDSVINLNREALPTTRAIFSPNSEIDYAGETWIINRISGGTVELSSKEEKSEMPEAAMHLLLNRGIANLKQIFTVESLLADLK